MMPDRADFTGTQDAGQIRWQPAEVTSPHLPLPVPVIAARDIPYIRNANRLQNLSIYLPRTPQTAGLIDTPVRSLPGADSPSRHPRNLVHIHGGAWRDPRLTSASIEPAVARAFSGGALPGAGPAPVTAIASLNYTVSQVNYPAPPVMANPPVPYDAIKDNHTDLAREAAHPQHVSDVLHGLALLGSLGLATGSYILSGHSSGACPAFQSVLQPRATTVSATFPSRPALPRCSASTACTTCPRSPQPTGWAPLTSPPRRHHPGMAHAVRIGGLEPVCGCELSTSV